MDNIQVTSFESNNHDNKLFIVKQIDIIEKRLHDLLINRNDLTFLTNINDHENDKSIDNSDDEENELFSRNNICLYFMILGNLYYKLYSLASLRTHNITSLSFINRTFEYKVRCINSLKCANQIAEKEVQIDNYLRICCGYSFLVAMKDLEKNFRFCKKLANKIIMEASEFYGKFSFDNKCILLLQKIHHEFLLISINELPQFSEVEHQLHQFSKKSDKIKNNDSFWNKINDISDKFDILVDFNDGDSEVSELPILEEKPHKLFKLKPFVIEDKNLDLIRQIRKFTSTYNPILLDDLSTGAEVLGALDKIFRIYVRGHALIGQRIGGNSVIIDGKNPISFAKFLLSGPYINWNGFLCFLQDFNISLIPKSLFKNNKKFLKFTILHENMLHLPSFTGPESPIELKQAAVLFIEASQSAFPLVTLEKYILEYNDRKKLQIDDPWVMCYNFLNSEDYDLKFGLNFMQFLDCIGKLGALAYKEDRFNIILPTFQEKVEHFLAAHLGKSVLLVITIDIRY